LLLYWVLKNLLARPLFHIWWRPWIEGKENLPDRGAVILVANHLAEGETVLLPAVLKRRLTFTPKLELFQMAGPKGLVLKWFLQAIKMLPLDRSGGKASADNMLGFAEVLRRGDVLIMFPEGSRSPDGRLYKGRTGAARLALREGVPVIPIAVSNTKLSKNRLGLPRLQRPGIRIGKPMDFAAYRGASSDRDTLRWVTDEMMNAIMELSGQTYVDVYVSVVQAELRKGKSIEEIDVPVLARPGLGRPLPPIPARETEAA
jgi:1-acyl-sn-glycerol-3-phosphate acyltransferase